LGVLAGAKEKEEGARVAANKFYGLKKQWEPRQAVHGGRAINRID